jgi:hypothetical protein
LAPHIARAHQPGRPPREGAGREARENHRSEAPTREPAPAMAPGDDDRG